MKKMMIGALCLLSFASFAGVDYETKAACQADINKYIEASDSLPEDISMGYWQWFNLFLRSQSQASTSCSNGSCTRTIKTGGCDAVGDSIAFTLIKPQLEEELTRMQAHQESLKDVKTTIICHFPEGQEPAFEDCSLS